MSQGTALRDAASAGPGYDFVAPVRLPPAGPSGGGNPAFRGGPRSGLAAGTGIELGAPLVPGYLPDKAPGLSQVQKTIVSVALALLLLAVAGYVGSFGWQAYRDHARAQQVDSTSITFPQHVAGLTKRNSPRVAQLINRISTPAPAEGAMYVAGKSRVVTVLAGVSVMSDAAQADFLASAQVSAKQLGYALSPVDPGRLGGQMWCGGDAHTKQTFCAFTDVAAYGAMTVPGFGNAGVQSAVDVRAAIEHRS